MRVGEKIIKVFCKRYGETGRNESGEELLDLCGKQELVMVNTILKNRVFNKNTWEKLNTSEVVDKDLLDYFLLESRIIKRLQDVKLHKSEAA